MAFLFTCAALVLFFAGLASYLPWQHVAIDLPSHFVFQYVIAAFFVLLAGLMLNAPAGALLFVFVSLSMGLVQLSPYIPFPVEKKAGGVQLKFLQANVLRFSTDTADLRSLIVKERPDVIALAETTGVHAAFLDEIKNDYPHQTVRAKDNSSFGMAVVSKIPMENVNVSFDGRADIPSISFHIKVSEKNIEVVSLHPANPVKDMAARDRELAVIANRYKRHEGNLIMLGDFNATPYCPAYRNLERTLKLKNARDGAGILGTYPAAWPFFMRLPIDHFLASDGITIREHYLGGNIGSDHLPLVTVVSL